ncbi:hypothetical protein N657DRAFT_121466 [Parathielavia appendiculata]|uniref:Uncharacterized protein n=1 Tax=Parathielavia appendiculata TaxID=2587402 RepID=A0AAN6TUZ3_9PEZI|nr:hypothetical protein N657DRAFT_121466 [Parathielavia appendiculata]
MARLSFPQIHTGWRSVSSAAWWSCESHLGAAYKSPRFPPRRRQSARHPSTVRSCLRIAYPSGRFAFALMHPPGALSSVIPWRATKTAPPALVRRPPARRVSALPVPSAQSPLIGAGSSSYCKIGALDIDIDQTACCKR